MPGWQQEILIIPFKRPICQSYGSSRKVDEYQFRTNRPNENPVSQPSPSSPSRQDAFHGREFSASELSRFAICRFARFRADSSSTETPRCAEAQCWPSLLSRTDARSLHREALALPRELRRASKARQRMAATGVSATIRPSTLRRRRRNRFRSPCSERPCSRLRYRSRPACRLADVCADRA